MELERIQAQQEAVARDGIIAVYVGGEEKVIEAASHLFGLGQGNQDLMTEDRLRELMAGVDDGRLSACDAFSSVLDRRLGLRKRIEIEALGKLCGMYVERLYDEQSSSEFEIFAKDRMAYFLERVHDLTEI